MLNKNDENYIYYVIGQNIKKKRKKKKINPRTISRKM